MSTFTRPAAGDDPQWPRASTWLASESTEPALTVVGVPCSVGSISPSQAWQTPPAVRQALARLSTWDPEARHDLATLPVADVGDWPVQDMTLQPALDEVALRATLLNPRSVHVFLGGDNAITRPLVRGLLGPDLGRVGLLTFDAHHDVRHLDEGPRNGTPVRGLIQDGLPGGQVIQIGIGSFTNSAPYAAWCAAAGITVLTASQVRRRGMLAVVGEALADLSGRCDAIFVDFDMDVLDVAYAPACPGARPGGLTPEELLQAAHLCGAHPAVLGADLVEVDATTDHDGRTVMVTAMTLLAFASGLAAGNS
ncbi:MAG: agmatinase family protein [Euzebya sp.]